MVIRFPSASIVAFALALAFTLGGEAQAQSPNARDPTGAATARWRIGPGPNGTTSATVLADARTSTGGTSSFHPSLTITCRKQGEPRWSLSVPLATRISGERTSEVTVQLDDAPIQRSIWTLGFQNRALISDGPDMIKTLKRVKRLRLSWSFGVMSGNGHLDVALSGLDEALATLAQRCETPAP
ncbi:MAG: hypothetical protein WCH83_11420 [Alphaproteobacteria bacterium]